MEGPPAQPDEMPRITLSIVTLAQAARHRRKLFLREVQVTYLHELGHYPEFRIIQSNRLPSFIFKESG